MARKASEINTLLRVQSWTVDEHRRQLGQLEEREQSLIEDRAQLDRQLIEEQKIAAANPTSQGHAYAVFAEYVRERQAGLDRLIAALAVEIEEERDRLAEAYRELKVLEEVQKAWRKAELAEEARREQGVLDEIAQNLYRRRVLG